MDFELSEEQALLKATLSQYLGQHYDFAARTRASREEPGYRTEIWSDFANKLGLFSLAGSGAGQTGDAVAQMIVMEEVGRALVLEPLAETLFLGAPLLDSNQDGLLDALEQGQVRLAIAIGEPAMGSDYEDISTAAARTAEGWQLSGRKSVVVGAPWATHLIVAARTSGEVGDATGLSLFLVPAETAGLALHAYPTLDGRRAADIDLHAVAVPADALLGAPDQGLALLEELRDRAISGQAAEAVGLLSKLVADTVDYAKQRKQFGQTIGSFQALQHRMVDMHVHVELTRSAAIFAALNLNAPAEERAMAASAAKVTFANACRFVGQNAVQLHGGMGMTDELPIGHYFKRATVLENEFGTAGWHLTRHARQSSRDAG